jgi:hypothetical protein
MSRRQNVRPRGSHSLRTADKERLTRHRLAGLGRVHRRNAELQVAS